MQNIVRYLILAVVLSPALFVFQNCGNVNISNLNSNGPQCAEPTYSLAQGFSGNNIIFFILNNEVTVGRSNTPESAQWTYEGAPTSAGEILSLPRAQVEPASGCQSREVSAKFTSFCGTEMNLPGTFNFGPDCEDETPPPTCVNDQVPPTCVNGNLTQARVCFPAGANCSPACTPQVVGSCNPETPTPPTTYNTTTTDTACGGNFEFQKEEIFRTDQLTGETSFQEVKFTLVNRTTSQLVAAAWSSSVQGLPTTSPPSYTIPNYAMDSCTMIHITAKFKNACNTDVTLGHIYTPPGCPPPDPRINVPCNEIARIPGFSRAMTAPMSQQGAGTYVYRDVQSLVKALVYNPSSTMTALDWPGSQTNNIRVENDKYLSMTFTAPANNEFFDVFASQGNGTCALTFAISKCEGDFYLGRDGKGCVVNLGERAMGVRVHPTTTSAQHCNLKPGEKYYINVLGVDLATLDPQIPDQNFCNWFGGIQDN